MGKLIRVLQATPEGPVTRLPATKQERRQPATTTSFSPDRPTRSEDQ
jgi:hypothetical protein